MRINRFLFFVILSLSVLCLPLFAQTEENSSDDNPECEKQSETPSRGLVPIFLPMTSGEDNFMHPPAIVSVFRHPHNSQEAMSKPPSIWQQVEAFRAAYDQQFPKKSYLIAPLIEE